MTRSATDKQRKPRGAETTRARSGAGLVKEAVDHSNDHDAAVREREEFLGTDLAKGERLAQAAQGFLAFGPADPIRMLPLGPGAAAVALAQIAGDSTGGPPDLCRVGHAPLASLQQALNLDRKIFGRLDDPQWSG